MSATTIFLFLLEQTIGTKLSGKEMERSLLENTIKQNLSSFVSLATQEGLQNLAKQKGPFLIARTNPDSEAEIMKKSFVLKTISDSLLALLEDTEFVISDRENEEDNDDAYRSIAVSLGRQFSEESRAYSNTNTYRQLVVRNNRTSCVLIVVMCLEILLMILYILLNKI